MKKNLLYFFVCLCMASFILISCDDDDDPVQVEVTTVKKLLKPEKDKRIVLESVENVNFIWEKANTSDSNISYEVVFDVEGGNFSKPLYIVSGNNNGTNIVATITAATLDYIAELAGAGLTEEVTIKWAVQTKNESVVVLSEESRELTLVRLAEAPEYKRPWVEDGEMLYIAGEGSEEGQQMKKIDDPDRYTIYEIYTKIEAGRPFYFYSLLNGEERYFNLTADKKSFGETAEPFVMTVGITGVYRIRFNFEKAEASIQKIDDVVIYVSATKRETSFEYVANGVWKIENYNVQISSVSQRIEERYKIVFKINAGSESWGQTSPIYGDRPSINMEGYRDMAPVGNNDQYPASAFKFPDELCDENELRRFFTDITLFMTAEKNYTHDFENYYEPELGEIKYENPIYTEYSLPDPDVIRGDDGLFYLYATEHRPNEVATNNVPIMVSEDLINWERSGETLFTAETHPQITDGTYGIWAPTITKVGDQYLLYYSQPGSGDGQNHAIGVASAPHPRGPFTDHGKLIDSSDIGVNYSIDAYLHHEDGRNYLFWGSFRGIWMIELDEEGLKFKEGAEKVKMAGDQYEAAYIHKRNGYYYLVCSVGNYNRNGTYHLTVGRSTNLTGPYYDKSGNNMLSVNHHVMLKGNTRFTSPGHCSRFITDDNGQDWTLYHAYEAPYDYRILMLDPVYWDEDGWPIVYKGHPSSKHDVGPVFNR